MTPESPKEYGKRALSALVSRIFIAITLLILAGIFMALGACSTSESNVTFTAGGPGSPTAAGGDAVVTLEWSSVTGASSYKIYWNNKGGVSATDTSIADVSTPYKHTGLTNGTRYFYRIAALTGGGTESPLSDEASAIPRQPKPSTPKGLAATATPGEVALTWHAAARAASYKIYWNITGSVTSEDNAIEAAGLSYKHTGLTNGETYYYRVSAVNDTGESDLSAQVSALPSAGGGGGGGAGNHYDAGEWYAFDASVKTNWSRGIVTFSITGLDYSAIPMGAGQDFFLFMAKLTGGGGQEANFHYNIADRIPRLISQRFDGTCSPFCEQQSRGDVNWRADETYSFRFEWTASTVTCLVKDSSGTTVHDGSVDTFGAFTGVEWVRIGNGVLPPYPGLSDAIAVIAPALQ